MCIGKKHEANAKKVHPVAPSAPPQSSGGDARDSGGPHAAGRRRHRSRVTRGARLCVRPCACIRTTRVRMCASNARTHACVCSECVRVCSECVRVCVVSVRVCERVCARVVSVCACVRACACARRRCLSVVLATLLSRVAQSGSSSRSGAFFRTVFRLAR